MEDLVWVKHWRGQEMDHPVPREEYETYLKSRGWIIIEPTSNEVIASDFGEVEETHKEEEETIEGEGNPFGLNDFSTQKDQLDG
jgi:hypothetical protein